MNLLIIGGSNTRNSINRKLANYAASLFTNAEKEYCNISELDLPLYSLDREASDGIHPIVTEFAASIDKADLIILSLAENNGSYNAGFKNLLDWTSRIKTRKTWGEKNMLLMATSPGARGGATVLETATNYFPRLGAKIVATFSLPEFHKNFDEAEGIKDGELKSKLMEIVKALSP